MEGAPNGKSDLPPCTAPRHESHITGTCIPAHYPTGSAARGPHCSPKAARAWTPGRQEAPTSDTSSDAKGEAPPWRLIGSARDPIHAAPRRNRSYAAVDAHNGHTNGNRSRADSFSNVAWRVGLVSLPEGWGHLRGPETDQPARLAWESC